MTQKNKTSTYTKGMEIRRQVLGIKHVENAIKNTNKIVSCQCLESIGAQKYCQDCLLSMFGEIGSSKLLSRLSPVDVW